MSGNIELRYDFMICRLNRAFQPIRQKDESKELISRLNEAYPNEDIM